jgi:hypothetical protein
MVSKTKMSKRVEKKGEMKKKKCVRNSGRVYEGDRIGIGDWVDQRIEFCLPLTFMPPAFYISHTPSF